MNTKKILAITIIVLAVFSCLSVVSAGWFDFLGGEKHLEGDGSQITVPGNYTLDDKKLVASCGDINVTFTPQLKTDDKFEDEFFGAVKTKGNESGYENVTNKTVNGYTVHEFAAHPDKLKNMTVSTEVEGSDESCMLLRNKRPLKSKGMHLSAVHKSGERRVDARAAHFGMEDNIGVALTGGYCSLSFFAFRSIKLYRAARRRKNLKGEKTKKWGSRIF